jgi:transcriptional regulator with XRE-family HTH domain
MLFFNKENPGMPTDKQQFVNRLAQVTDILKYPERGRQTQLAKRYNLAQPSVRKWFTGDAMPSHEVLADLCRRSAVSYDWLMTGRGSMFILPNMEADPVLRELSQLIDAMNEEDRDLLLRMAGKLAQKDSKESGPKK